MSDRKTEKQPSVPWILGDVDYGPTILPPADLAAWAFELAADSVEDWPEAHRRVGRARRAIAARLSGARAAGATAEDVVFTAALLARLFEADLELDMAETLAIFDAIGLPTDDVSLTPRRKSTVAMRPRGNVIAFPKPHHAPAEPRCPGCEPAPRLRNAA